MIGRRIVVFSGWLIADRIIRMSLGLLVWAWLARYLGPETFGVWSYALALCALCGSFAGLGLDGIVVQELVKDPSRSGQLLGTALTLRVGASLASLVLSLLVVSLSRPGESLVLMLVALNAIVLVLQSAQVIDFHFQSHMNARPAVLAAHVAFLLASVGRLLLIALELPIVWLGVSMVLEAAFAAGLLLFALAKDDPAAPSWRFDRPLARQLLRESWPLMASGMAVMIYMRVDQVMVSSMAGDMQLGQFSAASRISEAWYFIPMAVVTAALPALLSQRKLSSEAYGASLQALFDAMGWLAVGVAVALSALAPWLISMIYGQRFDEAVAILRVQVWASVPIALSLVHGKWLLAEGLQRYGLVSTALGAVFNVALNLMLIPDHGAIGAAVSTLATQSLQVLLPLMFPATRPSAIRMLSFVLAPAHRAAMTFGWKS